MKYLIFSKGNINIGTRADAVVPSKGILGDAIAVDAESFMDALYSGSDCHLALTEDTVNNLISILEGTFVQEQFFEIPDQHADRLNEVAAQLIMDRSIR